MGVIYMQRNEANRKSSPGLALLPILAMLVFLVIGYGVYGLPIESLLLASAVVAAGVAWETGAWLG